jgi:hypothetical protein
MDGMGNLSGSMDVLEAGWVTAAGLRGPQEQQVSVELSVQ